MDKNNHLLQRSQSLQQQRHALPIWRCRELIKKEVQSNQFLVLVGETGSGKTTQIPQFLNETGLYTHFIRSRSDKRRKLLMIGVVQPRRVAAVSVAKRVSDEVGSNVGSIVGYSVRFEEKYKLGETRIKYLTGGMLLREALIDPMLSNYSIIILDEAHERTAQFDILLGIVKNIAFQRPLISDQQMNSRRSSGLPPISPLYALTPTGKDEKDEIQLSSKRSSQQHSDNQIPKDMKNSNLIQELQEESKKLSELKEIYQKPKQSEEIDVNNQMKREKERERKKNKERNLNSD
ncbi:MAG: putative pre-mRNA-splicing factor ATP-dependent RNA helicase PRP22 [Streblomastix strix]|uniref:RNA helicase n=1 Tax=Streblomastix strix TaxID=222440 RepID=A0A5J4U6M6_9EUKA|nr:MAG: putative pre-mRNA-splicing factor ATP-dependent RNA helicase PRP22 [Streblomastix strix]